MKTRFVCYLACAALGLLGGLACAEEPSTSAKDSEQKRLDAHVSMVYKDTLHCSPGGVYWYTLQKGKGKQVPKEGFVYVHLTEYNMYYDIVSSTRMETAKQLGNYSQASYYSPDLYQMGVGAMMVGLEEILGQMCVGEARRLILPSWLSGYTQDASYPVNSTSMVYDVEVVDATEDIDQYQIDLLEAYRKQYYPATDSLKRGFYKVPLKAGQGDTLAIGTDVKVWYVGKYLDGFCFDTNVADTAKFYFNYVEGSDTKYQKYSVNLKDPETLKDQDGHESAASYDSSNDAISGFHQALRTMRYGETAFFFFHSDFGYKNSQSQQSGSNNKRNGVPPYKPLSFWISVPPQD